MITVTFNTTTIVLAVVICLAVAGFFYGYLLCKIVVMDSGIYILCRQVNKTHKGLTCKINQQEKYLNKLSSKMAAFEITGKFKSVESKEDIE